MRPWLERLRFQEMASARRRLMSLSGVGDKVADCVLLYGLGFREAFPVDVWVRRAVQACFFGGRDATLRDIRSLAAERFGQDAGYAQQFLFHLWRTRRNA
jgi:N-glycosylase/DNA lyase